MVIILFCSQYAQFYHITDCCIMACVSVPFMSCHTVPQPSPEPSTSSTSLPPEQSGVSSTAHYQLITSPLTILHPLHGTSDPFSLVRTLEELQPTYVVLYDAHMMFVRQLEVSLEVNGTFIRD